MPLTIIGNISFNMEVKVVGFHDLFEIFDEFDLEFLFLQKKTCNRKLLI